MFNFNCFLILELIILEKIELIKSKYSICDCGVMNSENSSFGGRIIGGEEITIPHKYPWLVYLEINDTFACGGSIISKKYILTAAHCVKKRSQIDLIKVTIGQHDKCMQQHSKNKFSVKKIVRHHNFDEKSFTADIMLIELASQVLFSKYVRPICLPKYDITTSILRRFKNTTGTIVGWGRTSQSDDASTPCKPRETKVPILQDTNCGHKLSYSLFCAGYLEGGRDSCQGDSGGPLQIINKKYKYQIIGIVSNGIGCALIGLPGLYTDVIRYLPWIYQHIRFETYCF